MAWVLVTIGVVIVVTVCIITKLVLCGIGVAEIIDWMFRK